MRYFHQIEWQIWFSSHRLRGVVDRGTYFRTGSFWNRPCLLSGFLRYFPWCRLKGLRIGRTCGFRKKSSKLDRVPRIQLFVLLSSWDIFCHTAFYFFRHLSDIVLVDSTNGCVSWLAVLKVLFLTFLTSAANFSVPYCFLFLGFLFPILAR